MIIDELYDSEYIKFNCINKGICCNINHIYKNKKPYKQVINDEIINDKKQLDEIILKF